MRITTRLAIGLVLLGVGCSDEVTDHPGITDSAFTRGPTQRSFIAVVGSPAIDAGAQLLAPYFPQDAIFDAGVYVGASPRIIALGQQGDSLSVGLSANLQRYMGGKAIAFTDSQGGLPFKTIVGKNMPALLGPKSEWSRYPVRVAIVLAGINDAFGGASAADIYGYAVTWSTYVRAQGGHPILVEIPRPAESVRGTVETYNMMLRTSCPAERCSRVWDDEHLDHASKDGTHPATLDGYDRIAAIVQADVRDVIVAAGVAATPMRQ